MKKMTIAMIMALSLTSACVELYGDSTEPASLGSASSVAPNGDFTILYVLLGLGLYHLLNNGNSNSSPLPLA